ncbi:MAG: extracellular solute-binding protein [Roseibium album]|uniref:Putative ABC transporter-binding protein n=1 Tax=Roseibium album TaxID=311410 RepID=A0A0M7AM32_9HYPH|nr:extracellular solute-binding protein [Roseibium album]MBG6156933.1 multiple sugar transport system substrate-binding protein [Labrenzia sp. EL_162]MBG6163456.1 multiple sugar transport system substrate-binding protein [Labrenzia sp. EL_195]MBG6172988.1 multiple sugar transport system substrate-binding protein [Labrenzia sp. EL_132]MBG6195126.1 multiple sugar transport system substrate-binding protein [Labrenzia sp. EL_159]MBG6203293.1 multiple sugar transport system substrate-binding protei
MLKYLKSTVCAVAGLALGATAALANPYEEFAGETLVVNFPAHPHFDAVMKVLPEFTKETGIRVEVDQLQYLKMRERQTLELTKNRGDYDLIAYVVFSKADYVYADQLENLARFFMNPKLADPNYEAEDLIDGYVANIGVAGGKKGYLPGPTGSLFGLPFGSETSILGYRKDIFDKHDLKVPETYDELLELVCLIPELEPGMGGLASRAASGHHASHAFLLHLAPLGGRIFDDEWKPIVNNEAGVEAAEALKKIVNCGAEGSKTFGFAEAGASFLQGNSAMFLDSTVFAGQVNNPDKSKVVGLVEWAPHPVGERAGSQTGGFGIGIPKNAQNKDAAFLLMQWLTSKKADKLIAMAGGNPSRYSTHADADVNEKFPHMATFGEALKNADPDWRPIIPVWGKINADLGTTLSKIIVEDAPVQESLNGVAERTQAIMDDAGYYTWTQ